MLSQNLKSLVVVVSHGMEDICNLQHANTLYCFLVVLQIMN